MATQQSTAIGIDHAIGIDVGGTSIKAGLVNKNGRILSFHKYPIPHDDDSQQLVTLIAQSVNKLEKEFTKQPEPHALACADIEQPNPHDSSYEIPIAIALPGPLDPQRNKILRSINLPFLQPVRDLIDHVIQTAQIIMRVFSHRHIIQEIGYSSLMVIAIPFTGKTDL